MSYKIEEVHIVYKDNTIEELAVLWESNSQGWVRASYCDTTPCAGYEFLRPNEKLTNELLERVASGGGNVPDKQKKKWFPGKRLWER